MQGRPATVTIKTVIERRFPPSDHMLAEHDLQQATRFRGACGHIPSSQLFEIDAVRCAKAPAEANSNSLFPDFLVSHRALTRRRWWSWTGSNRRPDACKATALPTELQPQSDDRDARLSKAARGSIDTGGPGTTRTSDLTLIRGAL